MTEYKVSKVLDFKGLPCPMPIVKMSVEVKTMAIGDIAEVHTTDPGSIADFPAWAKTTGNAVLETKQEPGVIKIYVQRNK
jgi:TusA-related sulfurtransferase